jgi:DNA-nicking Smr family endonuclease
MKKTPPRTASAEERILFEQSIRNAQIIVPLAGADAAAKPARKAVKAAAPAGPGGLDGRTALRLRRGLLEPDGRLDLHGYTEQAAHRALIRFLRGARAGGHRLVLIVTGKGGVSPPDAPFEMDYGGTRRGVLKNAVPRWLAEPALAPLVAGTAPAHRRHGGAGALYVYLRK